MSPVLYRAHSIQIELYSIVVVIVYIFLYFFFQLKNRIIFFQIKQF